MLLAIFMRPVILRSCQTGLPPRPVAPTRTEDSATCRSSLPLGLTCCSMPRRILTPHWIYLLFHLLAPQGRARSTNDIHTFDFTWVWR